MSENVQQVVKKIASECGNDRSRMMDVVRHVQKELGYVSGEAMEAIARELKTHRVEVEGVVTFYAFLTECPKGETTIRLSNCVACKMRGAESVAQALEQAFDTKFGETAADGKVSLEWTSCIGLCDQGPAALVDNVPVTYLSSEKVADMAGVLENGAKPEKLVHTLGEGRNASDLIRSMVINNIRKKGPILFIDSDSGTALHKATQMTPQEVIRELKTARLRGRGGAGFPTGMKWEFTRKAEGEAKYIICNADEGEPGTFKDRVLLTEMPEVLFEGMAIAGYAVGARQGIVYLRGEYEYLRAHLEHTLEKMRKEGLLGKSICKKEGCDFDIRIQMGAGAYVCGEESALIESCEGERGSPRDRPPFPAQVGYLSKPTVVNNVETFCCAARIIEHGAAWFNAHGTDDSPGTKLLSVSGDCKRPGVYELPFGLTVNEFLAEVGGEEALAVQIGGPSGTCLGQKDFGRCICYEDVATGGSMMVFGPDRDVLDVAAEFMDFFIEESCGWCVPCRVGNVLIKERLDRIRNGKGRAEDLPYLEETCRIVKQASRCGLGQTSPNPVETTLKNFCEKYEEKLVTRDDGLLPSFDLEAALGDAVEAQGRQPVFHED
jgi:[NiFe] hydrogenase diaphorase moiety large subunit